MEKSRSTPRRRMVKSCDRCRRQKLKCDSARPCLLCVHSGHTCETTQNTPSTTETTKRRRSARQSRDGPSSRRATSGPNPAVTWDVSSPGNGAPNQQPSTNASTVDFARQVFNEAATGRSLTRGVLPGDSGISNAGNSTWRLKELQIPPEDLMWAAIDAYFSRMHWLLGLVHEGSFRTSAQRILSSASWERRDLSHVLLVLTVAALGLKSALADPTWPGHRILSFLELDGCTLMKRFVSEIRLHILDLMEDSHIEAAQVCMLLSALYGFHDSPSLAWTLAKMAINAAVYLELYKASPINEDPLLAQVRHHCWNNVVVLETYTSIIYGRSVSTDPAFARIHAIQDSEEMRIDPVILGLPSIRDICDTSSKSSFYNAQFRLYGLIRRNISQMMQIRASDDTETNRFAAIARCANESETLLKQWYKEIYSLYNLKIWMANDRWKQFDQSLQDLPAKSIKNGKVLILQAAALQITYDGALMLVHQPLLESRMRTTPRSSFMVNSVQRSLHVAVEAASRISRFPVHLFQKQFSISFIYFHLFTAGVILCLVPPIQPLSLSAQEAKTGVLRIIQTCRAMRDKDRTAKQTEELLVELFKVTTTREMNSALEASGDADRIASLFSSPTNTQADRYNQDAYQSQGPNIDESINSGMEDPYRISSASVQSPDSSTRIYRSAPPTEATGPNTTSEPIDPAIMPPAQVLQQNEETFGYFGKSMLDLIFNDQTSAWNMDGLPLITGSESGEHEFF
ncbi:hypothetical protein N7540_011306 [Penicillium herquei]|nr:hypothetical protein N7540_011306 [Penicillium herquei]